MKQVNYDKIRKERRFEVLYIEGEEILDLVITENRNLPSFSKITKLKLPKDYYVMDIYYSSEQKAFGFLIGSEKFSQVGLGCYPPMLNQEIYIKHIELIKNKDFKVIK